MHNNPLKYVDPDGLSAIEHQQMNRPGTQGTFFGSFSRGILDDTSWGASSWMLGDYVCDNWQSSLGYGMGTGVSMMAGLVYGGTEAKLLGAAGKGVNRAARWLNFAEKEVKAACKMEGTAVKISRDIAPKIERNLPDVGKGSYLPGVGGSPKSMPEGHMWTSGSPFKNKTAEELHQMFVDKGYDLRPGNPDLVMNGKGNYINPKNGRQFHIDPRNSGRYREPNHVDVSRPEKYNGSLPKKRFSYLDD
ncbi:putative rhs family protein remnant [Waddlia chondrophila 2032/99]|uniref:Putative rhs family protein remnant n=1 Tax=Waddlia chondrophila 2032/99 TaxID=765953 RepID=F8LES5_9BACT|nr:putative rhs family protein remnant [Waddlia chondrophila 2032/99]